MKRFLVSIASTAGLFVLAAVPAWADPTPAPEVQWSYKFTPSASTSLLSATSGSGSVAFSPQPVTSATGTSDIVLTNLSAASTAPNSSPASFGTYNAGTGTWSGGAAWNGTLTLTDSASNASHTFNFSGLFNGTFSGGDPTAKPPVGGATNIINQFTGTQSYSWTAPDGNQYTVAIDKFTPPGPPTSSNLGSISARVTVNGGNISNNPEPSTLLLSCLGFGVAGLFSRRKRRIVSE